MMERYLCPGLLGLGITALIAGFMSGMAGNVSAFSTVWTYDIYKPLIKKNGSDSHYVSVGRWATVLGIVVSIGTAYLVMQAAAIMDYVRRYSAFLSRRCWVRCSRECFGSGDQAALLGIACGHCDFCRSLRVGQGGSKRDSLRAFSSEAKAMAADLYRALWAFSSCAVVTILVSYCTKPKPLSELAGLVYGASELPHANPSH